MEAELFETFDALGIDHRTHRHPPVMTVEEARVHTAHLPGLHLKNLFLRDRKRRYWLVTARDDRRIDLRGLREPLGAKGGLSFASAERLREVLGVEAGSVTPLAALNDEAGVVRVILDDAIPGADLVNCHPLHNAATTALAGADLVRFLRHTGHEPQLMTFEELR